MTLAEERLVLRKMLFIEGIRFRDRPAGREALAHGKVQRDAAVGECSGIEQLPSDVMAP